MNAKVTLDSAGRIVLPKPLRDERRLSPGDSLDLTVNGGEVTMRLHDPRARYKKSVACGSFASANP